MNRVLFALAVAVGISTVYAEEASACGVKLAIKPADTVQRAARTGSILLVEMPREQALLRALKRLGHQASASNKKSNDLPSSELAGYRLIITEPQKVRELMPRAPEALVLPGSKSMRINLERINYALEALERLRDAGKAAATGSPTS